jgi:hypothetical protein
MVAIYWSISSTKEKIDMRNIIAICTLISIMQSCTSQTMNTDAIIEKYDTVNFSALKNKSIYFRSKGNQKNTSIYFVNIYKGSCSPYAVEFNDENKSIVEVKNHLVLTSCGKDYLSREEIEKAIKDYAAYRLCLLQVDEEGNVYINPDKQELPVLLRKSPNSTPKDIDKFKLYKGAWYIRKK